MFRNSMRPSCSSQVLAQERASHEELKKTPLFPTWLENKTPFPPTYQALPEGLLAVGGDYSPERLIQAYQRGIFPWSNSTEPILWWSPSPRMVLFPKEFRVSRSLIKTLRNQTYQIRCDSHFREVIDACGSTQREGQDSTWITENLKQGYIALHRAGIAHSVETWMDGKLVGGLYGLAIGKIFFGESMFKRVNNASKIAFAHLISLLQEKGCELVDCQVSTQHLESLGACLISREKFETTLEKHIAAPAIGGWTNLERRWFPSAPKQNAPSSHSLVADKIPDETDIPS